MLKVCLGNGKPKLYRTVAGFPTYVLTLPFMFTRERRRSVSSRYPWVTGGPLVDQSIVLGLPVGMTLDCE